MLSKHNNNNIRFFNFQKKIPCNLVPCSSEIIILLYLCPIIIWYNLLLRPEMLLTLLGEKGWANAWPDRVIEFLKQFVAFCNSFREKPREPSQSQATTRFYVCAQFSLARSPNSLEPFERQLFSTFKKSGVRRKSRSASLVPSFSTNSARYTVSSKTQLMTLLDKSQNLYDPTLSFM